MKSKIIMLFIAVITVISCGCLKKDKTKYTIKGRLMYDNISNVPAGNIALTLNHSNLLIRGGETGIWNFKSNSDGTFSITYDPANNSNVSLGRTRDTGFGDIMDNMPSNQNLDLGNVYLNSFSNLIIRCPNVNELTDTLHLEYYHSKPGQSPYNKFNKRKYIGKLTNNIVDTLPVAHTMNKYDQETLGYPYYFGVGYSFRDKNCLKVDCGDNRVKFFRNDFQTYYEINLSIN